MVAAPMNLQSNKTYGLGIWFPGCYYLGLFQNSPFLLISGDLVCVFQCCFFNWAKATKASSVGKNKKLKKIIRVQFFNVQ